VTASCVSSSPLPTGTCMKHLLPPIGMPSDDGTLLRLGWGPLFRLGPPACMQDNVVCHLASSLCAGFIAVVVGSPADVIKSRMMGAWLAHECMACLALLMEVVGGGGSWYWWGGLA
jgi:hypothetical protein